MKTFAVTSCRLPRGSERRGSVLVLVLIVIAVLALGAYTYSETMRAESAAATMYGRQVQTRALADSGVELAAAVLADEIDPETVSFYHDPDQFHGHVVLANANNPAWQGRFSIIAPNESDPRYRAIRFGFIDESSRLNINFLLQMDLGDLLEVGQDLSSLLGDSEASLASGGVEQVQRDLLMQVPGMTEEAADSVLDWIDDDDNQREFGAESDYYESLTPPYTARNGPIETLDELLKVNGVDPMMLFGEDANRNGLLDPNEDDAEASPPWDDADGTLNLGWSAFLTAYSREINLRADGSERIDVNQNLLTELYDAVEEEFGEDVASFVVAFRMFGPKGGTTEDPPWPSERDGSVTRGDLDLSGGSRFEINSLYDLVGVDVAYVHTDETAQDIPSPWSDDPSALEEQLPELINCFSTTDDPFIEGRININQVRLELLAGLPGISDEIIDAIDTARAVNPETGEPAIDDTSTSRATTGWLVIEGIVDLPTMRVLDRFLTTRGCVFRLQTLGYFDAGGPFTRLEAVIDASEQPPRIVFLRDLTELGKGFSHQLLVPE